MGLWFAEASLLVLWCGQSGQMGWRQGIAALLWISAGTLAAWSWRGSAQGSVAWDGERWFWTAHGRHASIPVQVVCHLDLQNRLLVLVRADEFGAFQHWMWWEKSANPMRWMDLRRALFSRVRLQAKDRLDSPGWVL